MEKKNENVTVNGIKVFNGTPHPINIVSNGVYNTSIRKYTIGNGEDPVIDGSIPSSGILSALVKTVDSDPLVGLFSIPVFKKEIQGVDPLPDGYDVYIVSALYANAYRAVYGNMDKLYTVADPVYSEDGRTILGSRGICPAF